MLGLKFNYISKSRPWGLLQYRVSTWNASWKPKLRAISFIHSLLLSYQIDRRFGAEFDIINAVLCAHVPCDLTIEMDIMDGGEFARFEFNMSFGRIVFIAIATGAISTWALEKVDDFVLTAFYNVNSSTKLYIHGSLKIVPKN